ncbi:MAG: hypothetical protein OQJ81_09925 [Melioribacteraceae bacterium]|nr:hypothetical protein [Melioribacteraceae bacterium]
MKFFVFVLFFISTIANYSKLLLEADEPGSTYELISSKLAPEYNPVEHSECVHPEFGKHIAEVFEFYSHVIPDNDLIRPKCGIYRSLNDSSSLRDEAGRFADFSIQEQKNLC